MVQAEDKDGGKAEPEPASEPAAEPTGDDTKTGKAVAQNDTSGIHYSSEPGKQDKLPLENLKICPFTRSTPYPYPNTFLYLIVLRCLTLSRRTARSYVYGE